MKESIINLKYTTEKITKLYDNLNYFDQYGNSIIIFIILTIFVFLVISYSYIITNIQPIKDDWVNQRCNPSVIPFAGIINKPDDKTAVEFAQENFTYCTQNILVDIMSYAVQPIVYVIGVMRQVFELLLEAMQYIRELITKVRDSFAAIAEEIMGRLMNFTVPLQSMVIGIKSMLQQVHGILVASFYTSIAMYDTLKSSLGAFLQGVILIMIILAALFAVFIAILFTIPLSPIPGIPFAIIMVIMLYIVIFLEVFMGIETPAFPSLCFDKDTPIKLVDGSVKSISEIAIGEKLTDGSTVTAKMLVDANNVEMYKLDNTIVSGSHTVYSVLEKKWVSVKNHKDSVKIDFKMYKEPFIYCLNTTTKIIKINNTLFTDWDEIYDDRFMLFKQSILNTCINVSMKDTLVDMELNDIHKYLDGGFFGSTKLTLKNGVQREIKDIEIGTILINGEKVLCKVEIDGTNMHKQYRYNLGNRQFVDGGSNLIICSQETKENNFQCTLNFSKENSLEIGAERKEKLLYHLITDKKSFYIGDIKFYDYNAIVDIFLDI